MPFDPTKPATNSPITSLELREQFTGLKDLIDAIPPGPPALNDVLAAGSDAGANPITNAISFEMGPGFGNVKLYRPAPGLMKLDINGTEVAWWSFMSFVFHKPLGMDGNRITNLADPAADSDADTQGARNAAITAALAGLGASLPVADPHVAGALWNDAGVVKVSAG